MRFWIAPLLVMSLAPSTTWAAEPKGSVDGFVTLSDPDAVTSLAGQWRVIYDDDPRYKEPGFDDSAWTLVDVPRGLGLQGFEHNDGIFWYRLHVRLDPSLGEAHPHLAVRVGRVDTAAEIYVDGVLVEKMGVVTGPGQAFVQAHDYNPVAAIPDAAFDDGEVVIAVRGERSASRRDSNPGRGGITHGPNAIGPSVAVATEAVVRDIDEVALAVVFVVVGLYHIYLWSRRREQRAYVWFGAFAMLMGVYVFVEREIFYLFFHDTVIKNKVGFCAVFLSFPVFLQFLWPFLGVPIRRPWRVVQGIAVSFAVLSALWPGTWFIYKFLDVFYVTVLGPEIIGLLVLLVRQMRAGNPEAKTIMLGGVAIALTALNNVAVSKNLYRAPELTNVAFLVFVFSMAVSLANRFARVYGELDDKNAALMQQDKLKDEFLANTSHELRTPLNGILGITEGLLDRPEAKDPEVASDLRMIQSSGQRLATLINDILDFSKLREGKLELRMTGVDLRAVADAVVRLLTPLASRKGLDLKNLIEPGVPLVRGDENRLQQVIVNLVGNAIKFTEEGEVRIEANVAADSVTVAVVDTGIGIAAADQSRIWNAFEQADGSTARTYGGTGLGLSITRQLIGLHGGTFGLSSVVGQGSRFSVTLPRLEASLIAASEAAILPAPTPALVVDDDDGARAPAAETSGPVPRPLVTSAAVPALDGRHMRVLVVDDEPINIRVLESYLKPLHFQVDKAESGQEAMALLDAGLKPDLVLLDVMMPRMSGYEVCAAIRERFAANELPVVLVTAKDRVADVVAGFDAGATDYLTKPISKGELIARIRTHLRLAKVTEATNRFVPFEFLSMLGKESLVEVERGDQVQREMSILFSDIRSFTTIVEKHSAAENFRFINSYLAHMEPAIKEHHGFVDSFIGDAIMALFDGDGTHGAGLGHGGALDAVRAGVAMQRALPSYNVGRVEQGLMPIRIGIGVQTGMLTCGTMGGRHHIKCGVIGDPVNTASRIEGMTKMYAARFLIGEATKEALPKDHGFTLRTVDRVMAKGKALPTVIYEVIDAEDDDVSARRRRALPQFEEAMQRFVSRDFGGAKAIWHGLANDDPDDVLTNLYLGRCEVFLASPPPEGWAGVLKLDQK